MPVVWVVASHERGGLMEEWRSGALCAQVDGELFFPEAGGMDGLVAKRICANCDVLTECREYALAHSELMGVWGGLSRRERQRIRARRVA